MEWLDLQQMRLMLVFSNTKHPQIGSTVGVEPSVENPTVRIYLGSHQVHTTLSIFIPFI